MGQQIYLEIGRWIGVVRLVKLEWDITNTSPWGRRKMAAIASEQVLQTLATHRPELEQMGVKSLRLFGSVARDEARDDSDIDFLVEFVNEPSLFELFELRYFLEDLFQCNVDLGLEEALREHLREPILKDIIYAF